MIAARLKDELATLTGKWTRGEHFLRWISRAVCIRLFRFSCSATGRWRWCGRQRQLCRWILMSGGIGWRCIVACGWRGRGIAIGLHGGRLRRCMIGRIFIIIVVGNTILFHVVFMGASLSLIFFSHLLNNPITTCSPTVTFTSSDDVFSSASTSYISVFVTIGLCNCSSKDPKRT